MNNISSQTIQTPAMETAMTGLKNIAVASEEEKEETCDLFLGQVTKHGNDLEKTIAECALALPSEGEIGSGIYLDSKTTILNCIAKGVSGPMGTTIAQVALEALEKSTYDSKPVVARTFAKALGSHGSDYEREVTSRTLAMSDKAAPLEKHNGDITLLTMVANGLPPSPTAVVAGVGVGLMTGGRRAYANADAGVKVGVSSLRNVAENGTKSEQIIANVVLDTFLKMDPYTDNSHDKYGALSKEQAISFVAVKKALEIIEAGVTDVPAALIELGTKVGQPYASAVLDTLTEDLGNPVVSAVAGALKEGLSTFTEDDTEKMLPPTFLALKKDTAPTIEGTLVRHALAAKKNTIWKITQHGAPLEKYCIRIGNAFLKAIAEHASNPKNSETARAALDECTPKGILDDLSPKGIYDHLFHEKSMEEIMGMQSEAFRTIVRTLKADELHIDLPEELERELQKKGSIL